MIILLKLHAIE